MWLRHRTLTRRASHTTRLVVVWHHLAAASAILHQPFAPCGDQAQLRSAQCSAKSEIAANRIDMNAQYRSCVKPTPTYSAGAILLAAEHSPLEGLQQFKRTMGRAPSNAAPRIRGAKTALGTHTWGPHTHENHSAPQQPRFHSPTAIVEQFAPNAAHRMPAQFAL